jgi:DNA-binding NarL/FixJ family response regulator
VVDDVPALRELHRLVLEQEGSFTVIAEAGDGEEAVLQAARHQPDVIVLDVSMPRRDGLEALPLIREVAPDSRIVVLSGFEASRLASVALEGGASAYLEKGMTPYDLVEAVKRAAADPR